MDFPEELQQLGRQDYMPRSEETISVELGRNPEFLEKTFFSSSSEEYESHLEICRHYPNSDNLILAPHAGHMEKNTGKQTCHISEDSEVSAWIFAGFKDGLDASKDSWQETWDYWHDASHLIDPQDYEFLPHIETRSHLKAVSFHCFRNEDVSADIVLGGRGEYLKDEINEVLSEEYDVKVAESRGSRYHGLSPSNIVNRNGSQGVQIEQDWKVLEKEWKDIAETVERVL